MSVKGEFSNKEEALSGTPIVKEFYSSEYGKLTVYLLLVLRRR